MNPLEHIGDFFETLLGLPGKALSGIGAGLASAFGVCRTCGRSHPPGTPHAGGAKRKSSTDFAGAFAPTSAPKKTPAPMSLAKPKYG